MGEPQASSSGEQRRARRYQVTDVLEVIDVFDELCLGRLVDISVGGMMLTSTGPIPLNQIFQVSIALPRPLAGTDRLVLGVESLWSRVSDDGRQVWTGFQLISVSDHDRTTLERLLDAL